MRAATAAATILAATATVGTVNGGGVGNNNNNAVKHPTLGRPLTSVEFAYGLDHVQLDDGEVYEPVVQVTKASAPNNSTPASNVRAFVVQ